MKEIGKPIPHGSAQYQREATYDHRQFATREPLTATNNKSGRHPIHLIQQQEQPCAEATSSSFCQLLRACRICFVNKDSQDGFGCVFSTHSKKHIRYQDGGTEQFRSCIQGRTDQETNALNTRASALCHDLPNLPTETQLQTWSSASHLSNVFSTEGVEFGFLGRFEDCKSSTATRTFEQQSLSFRACWLTLCSYTRSLGPEVASLGASFCCATLHDAGTPPIHP